MNKLLLILPLLLPSFLRVESGFAKTDDHPHPLVKSNMLSNNNAAVVERKEGTVLFDEAGEVFAYAFGKDDLLRSNEALEEARARFDEGFPVYLYGDRLGTKDYAELISQSDSYYVFDEPDSGGRAKRLSMALPEGQHASLISGSRDFLPWFRPSMSFAGTGLSKADYEEIISVDLERQMGLAGKERGVERILYSQSLMYSYVPGNTGLYVEASWQLMQDMGELDPNAYGYGVTSQISTSVRGTGLGRVNSYFKVTNTANMVVNDLAPKNKSNVTLNVGLSVGTSGVAVSIGSSVSSDPFYNYVPDRTHGSVMFQWDRQLSSLNDDFFGSGISWNTSSYRPSVIFKFWGNFPGYTDTTPGAVLISTIAK